MDNPTPSPVPAAGTAAPARAFERRAVMRAAVDLASPAQIVAHLIQCIGERRGCSVVGISAPYAAAMAGDAELRAAFLSADLLIPDGQGFVWGARLAGVPCPERLAIPDLCEQLFAEGDARRWKVFLYGATEAVNRAACASLRQRFPNLAAVEGQHGYNQGPAEEDALTGRLRAGGFNLLIVARPSPDKEKFLARCCGAAGVAGIAAGGYADILAGLTRRAPAWMQRAGCEWLFRVMQEPRRLWKRIGWANMRFGLAALWTHLFTPPGRPWWGSRPVQASLLLLALTAAYVGSINASYHFDDPEYIQRNRAIRSFAGLSTIEVLKHREAWWISNAICYKLSELFGNHIEDNPDVRIFRAWNIGCHLLAALALWGLLRRSLRASGKSIQPGTPCDLAAFGAAVIFAAHPLCTESVTYISGRDNGQGGMFYLLGLYFAAAAFDRMGLGIQSGAGLPKPAREELAWPRWLWPLVFSMAMGVGAVRTKEIYLTWPAAVALLFFCFYRGAGRRTMSFGLLGGIVCADAALAWGAANRREGCFFAALQAMLLAVIAGAQLGGGGLRPFVLSLKSGGWRGRLLAGLEKCERRVSRTWGFLAATLGLGAASVIAFPYAYQRTLSALTGFQDSSYARSLCTQAHAVPWMLGRALAPLGLNIDHDFPTISTAADARVWTGGAILLALVLFGVIGAFKRWMGAFGVLLALLVIAPSNSVIERGDTVSERNFYLAAAGGACVLAWLLAALASRLAGAPGRREESGARAAAPVVFEAGLWTGVLACCVAGPFTAFTILRNSDWAEPYRIWHASLESGSENKMRVLHNYGVACLAKYQKGRDRQENYLAQAEWAFARAIAIGEEKAEKGGFRPDETIEIKCFHMVYGNLAALHLDRYMKHPEIGGNEALLRVDRIFKSGLERTACDPDLVIMYAQFLLQAGRASDAVPVVNRSLVLHSWAEYLWLPLGLAYLHSGDSASAERYLDGAPKVREFHSLGGSWEQPLGQQSEIYAHLAVARLNLKKTAEGRAAFRESLRRDSRGVLLLLTALTLTRNSKLKPRAPMDPPDRLLMALSETRKDVIEAAAGAIEDVQRSEPEREKITLSMLRGVLNDELARRGKIQEKRRAMGFTDDPDAPDEPKPRRPK